ncbi:hypothetical protein AVEN_256550-1 [Araneus ventricosus]|uniref:Uncharacterized protein n=1 Tax=Araneus ventricosus TaxID=182803 RepID=A0A4Y2KAJ5_ARAVE|nr:hypothetical protein AVEN_256550-1 [Araneus ventricosus]
MRRRRLERWLPPQVSLFLSTKGSKAKSLFLISAQGPSDKVSDSQPEDFQVRNSIPLKIHRVFRHASTICCILCLGASYTEKNRVCILNLWFDPKFYTDV